MEFDFETINENIKACGKMRIGLINPKDGMLAETSITLNELIEYIHVTGACVSRHLNEADRMADDS
tara:strand:- start:45 stop:242 length:198 start_codon:yes stop_codon:yes gene_type:complete